jgi:hypothetical protein
VFDCDWTSNLVALFKMNTPITEDKKFSITMFFITIAGILITIGISYQFIMGRLTQIEQLTLLSIDDRKDLRRVVNEHLADQNRFNMKTNEDISRINSEIAWIKNSMERRK